MKRISLRAFGPFGLCLAAVALVLCVLPQPAAAQAVSGTLLGTVRDTTGAVVPGAHVVLLDKATGASRTVVTDTKGEYNAPSIPTGTYTITAEMSGFKKVAVSNVQVGVDQKVRIDLKLEVGNLEEALEIRAETPLIQTASSDLSATVDGAKVEAMPLNYRNFVSLTRTIPGVLPGIPGAGTNINGAGSISWRASAAFAANGQRPRDNNYLLDGVDNNESWLQTVVIYPSVDALNEFKIQTSNYAAEFGRSLGGVVNLQMKSGSNEWHGSGFTFARNDALDANNFFNNRAGVPRGDFSQNYFGGTVGGPIFKDKTFFFADYQGIRINQAQTKLSTIPSDKMRSGDFSEINRVIYDPVTHQPFPGNIIPQSRWDPAAANIIRQLMPPPNTAGSRGSNGQPINNYIVNPEQARQDNQFDVKINHTFNQNNSFFIRYSWEKTHRVLPGFWEHGDANDSFGTGTGDVFAQGIAFNDVHTFNEKWINEFRVGWGLIKVTAEPVDFGDNLATAMGIPNINVNEITSAMTRIRFNQLGSRNLGSNANQPLITNLGTLQFFDNVTHIMGRHTLKFGGNLTLRSREILNSDTIVGEFQFSNSQTSNCSGITSGCVVNPNTGFDVASFLLGLATSKSRNMFDAATYTETRPEGAVYIQDDFRVNSRLTLNLGLRWDVFVPWVEQNNQQSNFDPSTGRFVVAADNAVIDGVEVGRHLQTYSLNDWGPRFGFAWDAKGDGKTLVRGGYGIFWNWGVGGTSSSKAQNQPFLQAQAFTTSLGTDLTLSSGLPPPPGIHPELAPVGSTRSAFEINYRDSYAMNYNLNVQRQIGKNYLASIAYAGSLGRQMVLKTDQNQAPPVLGQTNQNVNRPYIAVSPALRQVATVSSTGRLNYNALLFSFQRRMADGYSFLVSYTYGKTLDLNSDNDGTVTLTNIFDPQYNYGPAEYDLAHNLVVSFIYELPFARNSKAGGWQVTGILGWHTGFPLTITQTQSMLSTGVTNNRPNRIGNGAAADPTINQWFDPTAFRQTADNTATFGDAGRGILRGPGATNVDASLIKNTTFGRVQTQIRIEAFNLFNHPQFAVPNTTFGNAAFGQITAMAFNPACAFCGTVERQIQLALKVSF